MTVNKFRFNINTNDRYINIPIQINNDLLGRDDLVDEYEHNVIDKVINPIEDFEVIRYNHNTWLDKDNSEKYDIEYKFHFFDRSTDVATTTPVDNNLWVSDYNFTTIPLYENIDFTDGEIYYNVNSFKGSFFKLDFYDTLDSETQQIYFTIVLPTYQGKTRLPNEENSQNQSSGYNGAIIERGLNYSNASVNCNEYLLYNSGGNAVQVNFLNCEENYQSVIISPSQTINVCFIGTVGEPNPNIQITPIGNCDTPEVSLTPTPSVSAPNENFPCIEYEVTNTNSNTVVLEYVDCDNDVQNVAINPSSTLIVCFIGLLGPLPDGLELTPGENCDPPNVTLTPTPTITPTPTQSPLPPGEGGEINPNPPGLGNPEEPSTQNAPENSQIKLPNFVLDYIGDKEGYFIYWLKEPDDTKPREFYMSAKFFNAKTGQFIKMLNTPQSSIPNKFNFDKTKYFYYRVPVDVQNYTYEVYSTNTFKRVGNGTSINWYEYINPQ